MVDVTVHAPITMDIWDAGRKLSDVAEQVTGARPTGVEVISESELLRRAGEATMPELMSAAEIGQELGVSRQRVHKLRSMSGFPAPLAELRGGAVWDAAADSACVMGENDFVVAGGQVACFKDPTPGLPPSPRHRAGPRSAYCRAHGWRW